MLGMSALCHGTLRVVARKIDPIVVPCAATLVILQEIIPKLLNWRARAIIRKV